MDADTLIGMVQSAGARSHRVRELWDGWILPWCWTNDAQGMPRFCNPAQSPDFVGLVNQTASAAPAPSMSTDPAVLEAARTAARRRVGREPTAAEVTAEVAAFDDRIARINGALAQRQSQSQIAIAYKQTGRFPHDIEAPLLGITPRAAEAVNPNAEARAGLQRMFTRLFNELAPRPTRPAVPQ